MFKNCKIPFYGILFFLQFSLAGQVSNTTSRSLQQSAVKLEEGVQTMDPKQTADAYLSIGDSYQEKGDLDKALEYYRKSEKLFKQLNDQQALSAVLRKIAKIEEKLGWIPLAAKSYEEAEKANPKTNPIQSKINNLDIERTRSAPSSSRNEILLNKKIDLLSGMTADSMRGNQVILQETDANKELYDSYLQLASTQKQQMRYDDAISNIKNAQDIVVRETDKVMALNNEISNLYLKSSKPDEAIKIHLKALEDKSINALPIQRMLITEKLGELYLNKKEKDKALAYWEQAYQLALDAGYTIKARDLMVKLKGQFLASGNRLKAEQLESSFLNALPTLLSKDSTLTDGIKIKAAEEKISALEKEKDLNDHLIAQQNTIHYLLIIGIVLMGIFLFLLLKAYRRSERANMVIELQSLRKEMNPHFIFNSLNTINHFISTHDEREANDFLSRFSTLMRSVLDNSNKDFILLEEELSLLKNYLELEHQRFNDNFEFVIDINPLIDKANWYIPNMLIQPYIENAIWHGLRYRKDKGLLKLVFDMNEDSLIITIEDNGIGIKESQASKTEHQKNRNSVSTQNIEKRIRLWYKLYEIPIHVATTSLYLNTGTKVVLTIPIIDEQTKQTKWKKGLEA